MGSCQCDRRPWNLYRLVDFFAYGYYSSSIESYATSNGSDSSCNFTHRQACSEISGSG